MSLSLSWFTSRPRRKELPTAGWQRCSLRATPIERSTRCRGRGCGLGAVRESGQSRSMSGIPTSERITLCMSAGISRTTTSSVGNTLPSIRWPPRVVPSDNPSTTCTCTTEPSSPSATSPMNDSTSHCSSTKMWRYCFAAGRTPRRSLVGRRRHRLSARPQDAEPAQTPSCR